MQGNLACLSSDNSVSPHQGWEAYCFTPCIHLSVWMPVTKCVSFLGSITTKAYRLWYSYEHNSNNFCRIFWNFTGIFFIKVWRCAWGLAVILWLIFSFFSLFEFSQFLAQLLPKHIDTGYLVKATPPTISVVSFLKLFRCFCQGLKMCMWFGCHPQIIFVTVLQFELLFVFPRIRVVRHIVLPSAPICLSDLCVTKSCLL